MATSNTTNLNLIKETSAEPIVNHRGHFNDNMDLIDAAYNTLASRSRGQQTWGNLKQNTTWGELIGTNVVAATTTTDNLELIQPGYDSTVDVESFNDNMSTLDSTIGAIDVTNDGSIADQLSSVRDSLSSLVTIVNQEIEWTTTTTMNNTGVSVTVPAGKPFMLFAIQNWKDAKPQGICISTLSNAWDGASTPISNNACMASISGYRSYAQTYYIWAKAENANKTNFIRVGLAYLNV